MDRPSFHPFLVRQRAAHDVGVGREHAWHVPPHVPFVSCGLARSLAILLGVSGSGGCASVTSARQFS